MIMKFLFSLAETFLSTDYTDVIYKICVICG